MRVFLTGATGFIGSAIIEDLLAAGHQVVGLARSDAAEESLKSLGVEVLRGSLEDLDSLKRGAAESDGVIHCAFVHDFSDYANSIKKDHIAIQTIGAALEGTNRPFVITSSTSVGLTPGTLGTEQDTGNPTSATAPRVASEEVAFSFVPKGVRVSVIRLPPSVHGKGDHGFVPALIGIARQKSVSAYIAEGINRWPSVHRIDTARLYRLALEKGTAGARYHGVADEGVFVRDIAQLIGKHLNVPVVSKSAQEAVGHFGFLGRVVGIDNPTSSKQTQQELGWHPVQASLLLDIEENYF